MDGKACPSWKSLSSMKMVVCFLKGGTALCGTEMCISLRGAGQSKGVHSTSVGFTIATLTESLVGDDIGQTS